MKKQVSVAHLTRELATCQYKYDPEYAPVNDEGCIEEARTGSILCIFHDENYVKDHYAEYEHEAIQRFEEKVRESSSKNEPLECIGYFLPSIRFAKLFRENSFSQPVNFIKATFYGANFAYAKFSSEANFEYAEFSNNANFNSAKFYDKAFFAFATFSSEANFPRATFSSEANFAHAEFFYTVSFFLTKFSDGAYFSGAKFSSNGGETHFNSVIFEQLKNISFNENDLSNVSFADSDITRIRFGDKISWGGDNHFTIVEEKWLKETDESKRISLDLVLSVYRDLRENYEFRLRYDDAGKLFIKEMELKRKYRTVRSKNGKDFVAKKNGWFRRNLSLTGLYYNLSVYGEDLKRPALILLLPVFILSTLYWYWVAIAAASSSSLNEGLALWLNASARTASDMSQLERKEPDLVDSATKTATLAILGTLLIPLRRKFERKYTR
jgi:uncharacterized protein YjbI with pentapeptide repeats